MFPRYGLQNTDRGMSDAQRTCYFRGNSCVLTPPLISGGPTAVLNGLEILLLYNLSLFAGIHAKA